MLLIIIAVLLTALLAVGVVYSIKSTPIGLNGYYGKRYFLIAGVALFAICTILGLGIVSFF